MRRLLLTVTVVCSACSATTYNPICDRPDYVDRVLEDVSAMIEGMANARATNRVVLRDPNFRSSLRPRVSQRQLW